MFAIRSGDWKLIEGLGSGGFTPPQRIKPKPGQPTGQLYNLATDRGEMQNVYAQHPDVVRSLNDKLERIRRDGRSRPAE